MLATLRAQFSHIVLKHTYFSRLSHASSDSPGLSSDTIQKYMQNLSMMVIIRGTGLESHVQQNRHGKQHQIQKRRENTPFRHLLYWRVSITLERMQLKNSQSKSEYSVIIYIINPHVVLFHCLLQRIKEDLVVFVVQH